MGDGTVRVGVLGAGMAAAEHAAAYRRVEGARVVSVFSRDAGRAGALADICGAAAVTDADLVICDPGVDAVDICLPTAMHRDAAEAALASGKHVFCETPVAEDLVQARAMRAAAQRTGRLLQVGLLTRSLATYARVTEAAASGEHGRLLSIDAYRLGSYLRPEAPSHRPHYADPSTELMTFDFDFVLWAMGWPVRLSASAVRRADGSPGEISALVSFEDGRHAAVHASGIMPSAYPFSVGFRAVFEHAALEHAASFGDGPPRSTLTIVRDRAGPTAIPMAGRNPYEVELQRFVDCVRGAADPAAPDVDCAVDALVLSTATRRALDEGRVVDVAELR